MKHPIIQLLLGALLAISFVTRAQANPWWPPVKTPVKTVQLALPCTNGGMVSVTVPAKTTSARRGAGGWYSFRLDRSQVQAANSNLRDDERIAADLERHF